ncbi:aspartyl-phosphate phosphatase Spo0E family protein [Clostridium estertheticum]|uniref:Aspartyl-phosphate phosphatase Spo0E family protein n=1 Tax=Clostridium estertheticum TaxID=238834 RepID=A0AA47I770_9CLOT|nr:aspartyl-phosphate phosphatase Spo0E family protein [Clostridium estertheticum]MBU3155245.1 aspartyl-phosphate phosphatase Spo0E family protein [Clostridium estertheticum]WAG61298.1 aspartyl-phosphate phosphatase Spo0E family protein [Clostridium estertheticum]
MNEKINLLRKSLENLISKRDSLINDEVIKLSQKLDKYIAKYYLDEIDKINVKL